MFLNFPSPKISAERLKEHSPEHFFVFLSELQRFQRDTIIAVADCLAAAARQCELTNKTVTFEELKAEAKKLLDYANSIVPGDNADGGDR